MQEPALGLVRQGENSRARGAGDDGPQGPDEVRAPMLPATTRSGGEKVDLVTVDGELGAVKGHAIGLAAVHDDPREEREVDR